MYINTIMYVTVFNAYLLISYIAVCLAGCFNGGNCTSPGVCTCSPKWTGSSCTQGMKCNMLA